jgi:membrane fusion protein, macrolide-specific efflux system
MSINSTAKVAVALAAALALAGCMPSASAKAPRYLTEKVAVGDIEKTVLGTGSLQPLDIVDVGAQATGQIQELKVELGDTVRRGQLIAVIDPQIQQNNLRNAEAALAVQQANRASQEATLAQNELTMKRQAQLVKSGASAQAALDQAEAQVKVSRANLRANDAQIRQAQISVERAKVDLSRTQIVAPIDGVVAAIPVREGQTVNAVQSAPTVVRLAKMDVMTVKAQISEADVINVRPGQKVYFTILGDPEKRYYGQIRSVEPAPEQTGSSAMGGGGSSSLGGGTNAAVYYNALFDVPNADGRLKAAMTAQVNVVLAEMKGVLTVPAQALGAKDKDGRYKVKVLGADNKTAERIVAVGLNNNVRAQVLSGLKAGDQVVVGDALGKKATPGSQQDNEGGGSASVTVS